jgi:hypothetical protein
MSPPWSSELAGTLRRDRQRLLVAFVELRAQLRNTDATEFDGGEDERSRLLGETELSTSEEQRRPPCRTSCTA